MQPPIIIHKHPHNGSITISALVGNHLVTRTYYGYTQAEAVKLFRSETKP